MKKSLFEFAWLKSWVIIIAVIPVLSSCLDSGDPAPSTPASYVSFYHGSPDAGGLDVYLGGTKISQSAFAYGNYSNYATFSVGNNQFSFTPTGSTTGLVNVTYNLAESRLYSLFIVNKLSNLETIIVKDSAGTLSSTGKSGIRLVHLSPDAPAVNIYTTGPDGKLLFGAREFKSATPFIEIDANVYSFEIRSLDGVKLATVENVSFSSGRFYTLIVRGFVSPPANNSNTLTIQQTINQ